VLVVGVRWVLSESTQFLADIYDVRS
jgi:hypothetical protein